MITTVFLDVDNTLLDFNACALASMKDAFSHFGLPFDQKVVYPTFLRINDRLWTQIEEGNLTKQQHYRIRWNLILKELHIPFDGITLEDKFVEGLHTYAIPVPGAVDLVPYLARSYRLCVTSNAPSKQQIQRLKRANLYDYFERFYFSEKIGHQKPSVDFFEACLRDLKDIKKENIILIGDSLQADILGGNRANIKTIWYDPKDLPADFKAHPDYVVKKLEEIKKIL